MTLAREEKIVFIGDSITYCGRSYPVGEGVLGALGTGFVALFDARVKARRPELGLRVVNMGDKGHTTRDLIARWQRDVLDLSPDRVVLMVGANDVWRRFDRPTMPETHILESEYAANLETLIETTLPSVPRMVLVSPFFVEPSRLDPMRAAMDRYAGIMREAARRHGLVFVDAQAAIDRLLAHVHSVMICFDRVHPSTLGHEAVAAAIYEALEGEEPVRSTSALRLDPEDKLLFVGDSITDCNRARRIGEGSPGSLGDGYVNLLDALLQTRHPELRIRTVNMGVSGDSTRELLERWQTDVLDLAPDRLVLLVGVNDCARALHRPFLKEAQVGEAEFEENLETLVRMTRDRVKSILLVTPYFLELRKDDALRTTVDRFGAIEKKTAARSGLPCVDAQAAFDALLGHLSTYELSNDRVHPGTAGHFALAETIYGAL